MAGITLEQAEAQLGLWMAASTAVASSQSYEIGGRKLTRADAATIRDNIEFWEAKVQKLAGGGRRGPRYGVSA